MAKQAVVKEYIRVTANSIGGKVFEELKIFASYEQNWQFLRIGKGGRDKEQEKTNFANLQKEIYGKPNRSP